MNEQEKPERAKRHVYSRISPRSCVLVAVTEINVSHSRGAVQHCHRNSQFDCARERPSHAIAIVMPHNTRFTKTGAKMAKKIVRREWTKADLKQLKTMAKARAGVTKISKSLKRTPGATSVMAAKLGVSLSMRP